MARVIELGLAAFLAVVFTHMIIQLIQTLFFS